MRTNLLLRNIHKEFYIYILKWMRLFGIDAQQKGALDARLVCRWNNTVMADGEVVSPTDFSQVYVVRFGH